MLPPYYELEPARIFYVEVVRMNALVQYLPHH